MRALAGVSLKNLQELLRQWNQPEFRARQIYSWIYKRGALDFDRMSDLPDALRSRLKEEFVVSELKAQESQRSSDGTSKLLFRLPDDNFVEAVAIPTEKRLTGCISSQAGCKFACAFCASGKAGFRRNLTPGEMCGEILFLKAGSPGKELSHIVFMGTGEPLDNYDNVLATVRMINSPDAFGIGARRITISTCGIVPGILRLAGEGMQIELSVSLHAPDDAVRSRLMPVNRIYPVKELMRACREYVGKTNRQVTFEYILIEGVNSGLQNAERLSTIVNGLNCKINIIPFNPVAGEPWQPPDPGQVRVFKDRLIRAGVPVTVRTPRGKDIDAACGQLRLRYEKP